MALQEYDMMNRIQAYAKISWKYGESQSKNTDTDATMMAQMTQEEIKDTTEAWKIDPL